MHTWLYEYYDIRLYDCACLGVSPERMLARCSAVDACTAGAMVANSIDESTLYQIASKLRAQSKILRLLDELAAHCQTL